MLHPDTFEFRSVPHVVCELGISRDLGKLLRRRFPEINKILVVTDPGFLRTGHVEPVVASLRSEGMTPLVYSEVRADPPESVVLAAAADARGHEVELVIGLGGGSSMDVAKLIAILAHGDQPLSAMYGVGNVKGGRLPLVQIPTTAGTGSEMTHISIVTTGETTKMGVVSHQLFADLVVLDAELTVGLPAKVTAATGIDAMVHAIEAFTNIHHKNMMSDLLIKQSLTLLHASLVQACENGSDIVARQSMLVGAMLAGMAVANAPCAAVHALAYPIGGIFHVAHGVSNSLVLPHVLRFNLSKAADQYAELAGILAPQAQGSNEARADALIQTLEKLTIRVGIETRLREVGVTESDLDRMAEDAMLQTRLLKNNPRLVTREDARAIYAAAL